MLQTPIEKPSNASTRWQDYVIPQCWDHFTAEDHRVWDILFERQVAALGSRIVRPFLGGLDILNLGHPGIPDLAELNARLEPRTGWRTVAVPGLVPDAIFFAMLADRVSRSAISSGRSSSSIISTSPTCSTTSSAMFRCSPIRRWRP